MRGEGGEGAVEDLVLLLSRLPGLGRRSARRAVLRLVTDKEGMLEPLWRALLRVREGVRECERCGNVDMSSPCAICNDVRRGGGILCVVEEVGDVWALERAGVVLGRYHVLGGVLSAVDGVGPDALRLGGLVKRVKEEGIKEVVLATSATVDGQTTAHFVARMLDGLGVKATRLARGLPMGGELDYMDEGTLRAAMMSRDDVAA